MKKSQILSIFFLLLFQSSFTIEPADQSAIINVVQKWSNAWNHGAGTGIGDLYSENADFVNIFGLHFRGRAEIEARHVKILQTFLQGSTFSVTDTQLREVHPDLVIGVICWKVDGFHIPGQDMNTPGETRHGTFTHVFINRESGWEITATHNALMRQ